MAHYLESIKRLGYKLKDLATPPLAGLISGYSFRTIVNYLRPDEQLSKSVLPQADELVRPVAVSFVYRAMNDFMHKIDNSIVAFLNTPTGIDLFSNSIIAHAFFFRYPSKFHDFTPKALTLLGFGLWEVFEHAFSKPLTSTGIVYPTVAGTIEDELMDVATVCSQPLEKPTTPQYQQTIKELEEIGYILDDDSHAENIFGWRKHVVSIVTLDDSKPLGRLVDVETLKREKDKPWQIIVFDCMYGQSATLMHEDSKYEWYAEPDDRIGLRLRAQVNDKNQPSSRPQLFSEVWHSLHAKS